MVKSRVKKLFAAAVSAAAAGAVISMTANAVKCRKIKRDNSMAANAAKHRKMEEDKVYVDFFDFMDELEDEFGEDLNEAVVADKADKRNENKDDKYKLDDLVGEGADNAAYEFCFHCLNKMRFRIGRCRSLVEKCLNDDKNKRIFNRLRADLNVSEFMVNCVANSIEELYGPMYTGDKNPKLER